VAKLTEHIILEQEKFKSNKTILLGYIINTIIAYIIVILTLYFLGTGAQVRYGLISYIYLITGSIVVIILISWVLINCIRLYLDLEGKSLKRFTNRILQNKNINLTFIKYLDGLYTLWFADNNSLFRMNIPIKLIIHETKLKQYIDIAQILNSGDEKSQIYKIKSEYDKNQIDIIIFKILHQLLKEHQGIEFLITLKYAKERHPGQQISYTKLHPLLIKHIAQELTSQK
jgi:hypothetical protein